MSCFLADIDKQGKSMFTDSDSNAYNALAMYDLELCLPNTD